MLSRLRPSLTYANVVSSLCLFLVLAGGTAYAANTVFSTDIVDGEVKTPDLASSAVTNAKVANSAVNASKIATSAVTAGKVASNAVSSGKVANESLGAADLAPGSVATSEVVDGSLNDEDIAQGTLVAFNADIGTVGARLCVERFVTGVNAQGDHLLLTPNYETQGASLIYSAEYEKDTAQELVIQVCNPTDADINDGTTLFNLLVIDAQ